jgi:hypothetical protein
MYTILTKEQRGLHMAPYVISKYQNQLQTINRTIAAAVKQAGLEVTKITREVITTLNVSDLLHWFHHMSAKPPGTLMDLPHLGKFRINEEVEMALREWLRIQECGSSGDGIFKTVPREDNCSNMLRG